MNKQIMKMISIAAIFLLSAQMNGAVGSKHPVTLKEMNRKLGKAKVPVAVKGGVASLQGKLAKIENGLVKASDAEKALVALDEVVQNVEKYRGSDNSIKKLLCEIKDLINACCTQVLAQLPCNAPGVINKTGIVIDSAGFYCVTTDLVHEGSTDAILVSADGVSIAFAGHSLTLNDNTAVALHVTGSHFSVSGGRITNAENAETQETNAGIFFDGVNQGYVDNMHLSKQFYAIVADNSSDIRISRTFILNSFGSNVSVRSNNNGVIIKDSTFKNDTDIQLNIAGVNIGEFAGIPTSAVAEKSTIEIPTVAAKSKKGKARVGKSRLFRSAMQNGEATTNRNIQILNTTLFNSDILFGAGFSSSIIVDGVTSAINDPDYIYGNLELGDGDDPQLLPRDQTAISFAAIIRNSTFVNAKTNESSVSANPQSSAMVIYRADNVLLENVIIQTDSQGIETLDSSGAGLVIGANDFIDYATRTSAHNVNVKNSVIAGGSRNGIFVDAPEGNPNTAILFENVSVSQAVENQISIRGTTGSSVRSSTVTGTDTSNGIVLRAGATHQGGDPKEDFVSGPANNNVIRDNVVTNNGATGILLEDGVLGNIVQDNSLTGNGTSIVANEADNTVKRNITA